MSWNWNFKFSFWRLALLVPNLEDYPNMTEKFAIGLRNSEGCWSAKWIFGKSE